MSLRIIFKQIIQMNIKWEKEQIINGLSGKCIKWYQDEKWLQIVMKTENIYCLLRVRVAIRVAIRISNNKLIPVNPIYVCNCYILFVDSLPLYLYYICIIFVLYLTYFITWFITLTKGLVVVNAVVIANGIVANVGAGATVVRVG